MKVLYPLFFKCLSSDNHYFELAEWFIILTMFAFKFGEKSLEQSVALSRLVLFDRFLRQFPSRDAAFPKHRTRKQYFGQCCCFYSCFSDPLLFLRLRNKPAQTASHCMFSLASKLRAIQRPCSIGSFKVPLFITTIRLLGFFLFLH